MRYKNQLLYISLLVFGLLFTHAGYSQKEYPVNYSVPTQISIKPGESSEVIIAFTTESSWYIYAPTGNNTTQGMEETNIIFQLPPQIKRKEKLQFQKPKYKAGHEIYEGKNIEFKQQFTVDKNITPGQYIIKAKITYQSCNDNVCLPPKTDEKEIKLMVRRK